MPNPDRTFKPRAFATAMLVFSGLGLPATGVVNHVYGFAPFSVERHAWMSAHNALGLLFVAAAVWHVVLNRRALWGYVKNAPSGLPAAGRELLLAGGVIAVTLLLFIGHAFHAGH